MRIRKVSTAPIPSVDGAVVDSLSGSSTTNAPSVRAVNEGLDKYTIMVAETNRNINSSAGGTFVKWDIGNYTIIRNEYVEYNSGKIRIKKAGRYMVNYACRMADGSGGVFAGICKNETSSDAPDLGTWMQNNQRVTVQGTSVSSYSVGDTIRYLTQGTGVSSIKPQTFYMWIFYLG